MGSKKFDYSNASKFFPNYSSRDKLITYGILGGIPRYLAEFDPKLSVKENIRQKFLMPGSFLNEEPLALLRMEVRDTNMYNSILQTIASGTNRSSEIASSIHEEQSKVNKYMQTLLTLRLISKIVPCAEKNESKKGIYKVADNFFNFWYRYEFANRNYYIFIGDEAAADEISDNINDYMRLIFEEICEQYIKKEARAEKLPFIPYYLGKWWGNNPAIKAQDDVDILALNKNMDKGLFCECKFTNKKSDEKDFEDILNSIEAFPSVRKNWIYVFSKSGWTKGAQETAAQYNVTLVTENEMFDD